MCPLSSTSSLLGSLSSAFFYVEWWGARTTWYFSLHSHFHAYQFPTSRQISSLSLQLLISNNRNIIKLEFPIGRRSVLSPLYVLRPCLGCQCCMNVAQNIQTWKQKFYCKKNIFAVQLYSESLAVRLYFLNSRDVNVWRILSKAAGEFNYDLIKVNLNLSNWLNCLWIKSESSKGIFRDVQLLEIVEKRSEKRDDKFMLPQQKYACVFIIKRERKKGVKWSRSSSVDSLCSEFAAKNYMLVECTSEILISQWSRLKFEAWNKKIYKIFELGPHEIQHERSVKR